MEEALEERLAQQPDDGPPEPFPGLQAPGSATTIGQLARQLRKNLVVLVVPVGVITATLVALCGLIAVLILRERGLILDDQIAPFEPWPAFTVTYVTAALLIAHLAMVAMVVTMVAGSLLGRRVSAGQALRTVLRRSGALLVLLAVFVAAAGALSGLAATIEAGRWGPVAGLVIPGVLALALWRLPLAVPIVMLEHVGPLRAWARVREMTWDRTARMFWSVLVTVVLIPAALVAGLSELASQFTGVERTAAGVVAATVSGTLSALLQGTALAVAALDQTRPRLRYTDFKPLDPAAVADRLPAGAPAPKARSAPALATVLALVAPGLLYGGYLQINPDNLPALSEQPIVHRPGYADTPTLVDDGTLMLTSDYDEARLCSDRNCSETSPLPRLIRDLPYRAAVVSLPDESQALIHWEGRTLRLRQCKEERCTFPDESPVITTGSSPFAGVAAAASGSGILIAVPIGSPRDRSADTLRLLRCADPSCDAPRLLAEAALPAPNAQGLEPVAVATGAKGRPVAAFEDRTTGAITLLSCDDATCGNRVTRQPVGPASFVSDKEKDDLNRATLYSSGVRLVLPPDDRPVLLHRDIKTGAVRLLRCRTPDCAAVDTLTLTGPNLTLDVAELKLGSDGLPLIATFDIPRKRAILIACDVPDCSRRDTVDLGAYVEDHGELDMTVGRDGRPRVLWDSRLTPGHPGPAGTYLLTCRDARCR
ncbi:hypothetical protein ABZ897_41205 [Nonomuraea sp. NPDC046802]|uniref:hypothetical protein n=1 Tax=Nonomuraea sp. NPDC046802 TaxID=3154919 RepID=UPI00340CA9BE